MEQNILEYDGLKDVLSGPSDNFLTAFAFKERHYGLEISIVGCTELVPAPNLPECIVGVIYLDRKAIPVIDLKKKFGVGMTTISDTACILLAEDKENDRAFSIGVIVGDISDVLTVASEKMDHKADTTEDCPDDLAYDGSSRGLSMVLMNIDRFISDIDLGKFQYA